MFDVVFDILRRYLFWETSGFSYGFGYCPGFCSIHKRANTFALEQPAIGLCSNVPKYPWTSEYCQ